MSEPNTIIVELEAERDELRAQVATLRREQSVAIAEVEARALEHAALEFKSPETAWVRAYLYRMATLKRAGART